MTPELAAQIKALLNKGYQQHQVAAFLKINQGRVSEVNTGKTFPKTEPAKQLPFNFGQ
jgi:predicted XRE-type DNA-binding protein